MKPLQYAVSLLLAMLLVACGSDYYTLADFKSITKVDTHIHLNSDNPILADLAREDNFLLLTINVDSGTPIDEQERFAIGQIAHAPDQVKYLSTFSMKYWGTQAWTDTTLARLKSSFEKGALGIKVWKNIGIVERDSSGRFIMIDDTAFDPVVKLLIAEDKTMLGHLGEPKNCWLPLDQMTVNNDRNYFRDHPEYHMYLHPEYPSYDEVIASRDRFLEKHP